MERRKFSAQFKQQIIQKCLEMGSPNSGFRNRKHELNANMVSRWVRQFKHTGVASEKSKGVPSHVAPSDYQQVAAERSELASENEKLKKTLAEQEQVKQALTNGLSVVVVDGLSKEPRCKSHSIFKGHAYYATLNKTYGEARHSPSSS